MLGLKLIQVGKRGAGNGVELTGVMQPSAIIVRFSTICYEI